MQRNSYRGAFAVSFALAASASAASQDLYNNTTTYLNDGLTNGGTADVGGSNLKTLMLADDITFAAGSVGKPVDGFSFSVRNFNGVSVLARSLVTFYADNGSNAPGALLGSFSFFQSTEPANGVRIATFYPFGGNLFTVPASGKIWAGLAFDNRMGVTGATAAQLDNLGQGAYGPDTVGSSTANVFVTNAAGDYAVNDPVGHLENAGINLGWHLTTPIPGSVTWNLAGGGAWNFSDNNWTGGSPDPNRYVNWDNVTFSNAAGGTITLLTGIGITPTSTTVSATSGTYTFAGAGIATGTLSKAGLGRLVLTNANTFTGDTTVHNAGSIATNGSDAHLTLNCASGNALSGNLHIGDTAPTSGVAKVSLAQSNQIADNRVIYFDSVSGRFAYFSMRGNSETVAGIVSTATGGAIENGNLNGAINTDSTLTLAPPVSTTYSYGGIIRDADSGGGTGKLNLAVNGPGTQTLTAGSYTYTGTTTVNAGTLSLATSLTKSSSLTVGNGATARLTAGHDKVLATNTINTAGTGKLDVTDNSVVLRSSSLAAVKALITTGFNGGNWQGAGITSSSAAASSTNAIGFASNGVLGKSSFAGVTGLDANDILAKYTYYGDADLSGAVTLDDFTLFLLGYQNGGSTWLQGDFDYSGAVTLDDFTRFLAGYQQQGAPLSAIEGLIDAVPMSDAERAAMLAAVAAIPEPATPCVVLAATLSFGAMRRRRRSRRA
jgi:autotransporter-associated beta strand protein